MRRASADYRRARAANVNVARDGDALTGSTKKQRRIDKLVYPHGRAAWRTDPRKIKEIGNDAIRLPHFLVQDRKRQLRFVVDDCSVSF